MKIDWTRIVLTILGGAVLIGFGYLIPLKSPFDKDCPQPKPVSITSTHDSTEVDPLPITITNTSEHIKPIEGWYYTSGTQDTINGQIVDIVAKEKTWTYVDTLKDSTKEYNISGITEVVITGLKDDSINVDVLQALEIDPKPFHTPLDTVYVINTIPVIKEPEPLAWHESPVFWGSVGTIAGMLGTLLLIGKSK